MLDGILDRRRALVPLAFLALVLAGTAATADDDSFCAGRQLRAASAFSKCLGSVQLRKLRGSDADATAARIERCEARLLRRLLRIEARDVSCHSDADFESIRAQQLGHANQRAALLGVEASASVQATPGSDTLVWIYPSWAASADELKSVGATAQSTYNPQLAARNFQPLVGFALPVASWKAARSDAPFCPYTDDPANGYTYQTQMGTLGSDTSTSTLIGTVNVAEGEDWSSQSPQDLVNCLKQFAAGVDGIVIDDEYNVLSTPQRAAIMDWCNGRFASKRCGFVLGHNSTVIQYPGAMQNVCMAYTTGSENNCGGSQARNLYNEMIPQPPLFSATLPFDILD
jgi:hypothetical protein